MTRKLPFVVQPRKKVALEKVGTEESGIIEIERRGYITVGEKAMVDQAMQGTSASAHLRSVVFAISEAEQKTSSEVMADLSVEPSPGYLDNWAEEILECFGAITVENAKRDMVQATALLISRVDGEWTIEDTMQQSPELVKALSDFYVKENSQALEGLEQESQGGGAEGKK